jgi:hypothetical protein
MPAIDRLIGGPAHRGPYPGLGRLHLSHVAFLALTPAVAGVAVLGPGLRLFQKRGAPFLNLLQ